MISGHSHSMGYKSYTLFRSSAKAMGVHDGYQYCPDNTIRSRGTKSSKTT